MGFYRIVFFLLAAVSLNATPTSYENVTKLYIATFDRTPDAAGLKYWVNKSNLSLEDVARSFFEQKETEEKYPKGTTIADFIDAVYLNLFDRSPDQGGFDYWYGEISQGRVDYALFILSVINGAQGNDAVILARKTNDALAEIADGLIFLQRSLPGFSLPTNKQGLSDRNDALLKKTRYQVFENTMRFGIQKYNYYWQDAENLSPSTPSPQVCAEDYLLFPADESQKKSLGIHAYHCYKKSFIQKWKKIFKQNASSHIQLALVLWTAPHIYREAGCEGFYLASQKRYLKEGCYPAPSHYADYEDWIRFTAYRFGKYVDHYIVWNEADSTNWADSSSTRYSKEAMSKNLDFHMRRSFDIYSSLLKRTITAVDSLDKSCLDYAGECKNLVYVSLDRGWYSRSQIVDKGDNGAIRIRWQNMNLLDYIWSELALTYNWAIAVHPYGSVYEKSSNSLRFSTLKDLSAYQEAQIITRQAQDRSWLDYPQSRLFASKQNVNMPNDWASKAGFICKSYDVAVHMPELIAITHNHF